VKFAAGLWTAQFRAMGSPCEVLVDTPHEQQAQAVAQSVAACALRIDRKFSRYRDDNIVAQINAAGGHPVEVDEETANLIDFAALAWTLSQGLFDITSGVLRRAWRFDGGGALPADSLIRSLLGQVGWSKVSWVRPRLTLLPGMQIDFGGLGKEYAVDCALREARRVSDEPVLVNFGGDLAVTGPRRNGEAWRVGIEDVEKARDTVGRAAGLIELRAGALATSGDTYRFLAAGGERLSHILDPRTGRPVTGAPRSITVAAPTCVHAGMLTTMAMLRGLGAERFLQAEGVRHWIQRH
jgi:thiamine biosynthesis lipoprotein